MDSYRTLTDHMVLDDRSPQLRITVVDEPGAGGANHHYEIDGFRSPEGKWELDYVDIIFQNGPIKEHGVNGITHEVLLAIVIDRLRGFQAGSFANTYNEEALKHCLMALASLKCRTIDRISRGVEGCNIV